MARFSVFKEYGEELERCIRLPTFPLAIKLLEKETDIPEGAERPLKDFGYRMTLCQGYALSRKESRLTAMSVTPDQGQPLAAFPLQPLHPQALWRLPLFLKETCG
jgi:uncharacterized protein (DUF169 family)